MVKRVLSLHGPPRALLLCAIVGLSGCALTREDAQSMTSLELCERAYSGAPFATATSRSVALEMVAERGDSCGNYANIIATEQANRWAMFGAGMSMLQQSGPRPYANQGGQSFLSCQQQGVFTNCTAF